MNRFRDWLRWVSQWMRPFYVTFPQRRDRDAEADPGLMIAGFPQESTSTNRVWFT